jgi:tetratricopeptide (TPR) repeat protein
MAEELTTAFARVPGLRVASRGSASRFQDAGTTDAEIARQLGVQTILEGTVRRSGERIRVAARLVNPKDGTVLWADQYDRRLAEVFDVQDDMAQAIVTALRPTFVDTAQLAAARAVRGTEDLQAYDAYLDGRYYWARRGATGLRTAIGYFERALARDSNFARAWAGLSMAQVVLPLFTDLPPDSLLALASQNAERALRLDPTLADAHLALAYALKGQWRWDDSERQFREALARAPDDATVHHWYGVLLYVIGRTDEAVAQLRLAKQLDPLAVQIGTDLYYALYLARRYDEAVTEAMRVWAMDTTKADGSLQIGMIQLARGRPDSALLAFEAARRLGIGFDMRAFLSATYRRLGRTRRADSLYGAVLDQYHADRSLAYAVAIAAASAGDLDRAMTAVAQTIDRRSLFVTEISLPCDPLFDPLKQDPRFAKMLASVGMKVCPP